MLSSTTTATVQPPVQESHMHLSIQLEVMVQVTKLYQLYIAEATAVQLVAAAVAMYSYVN